MSKRWIYFWLLTAIVAYTSLFLVLVPWIDRQYWAQDPPSIPTAAPEVECWLGDVVVPVPGGAAVVGESQICGYGLRMGDLAVGPNYSTVIGNLRYDLEVAVSCVNSYREGRPNSLCEEVP